MSYREHDASSKPTGGWLCLGAGSSMMFVGVAADALLPPGLLPPVVRAVLLCAGAGALALGTSEASSERVEEQRLSDWENARRPVVGAVGPGEPGYIMRAGLNAETLDV